MTETLRGTFFCNKCGTLNTVGAQFCSQCGASTSPTPGAMPTTGSTPPNLGSPYSAPVSYAAVAPGGAGGHGGVWVRGVGAIIYAIIFRVVVAPVGLIFGGLGMAGMMSGLPHAGLAVLGGGVTFILLIFGSWLYEAFLESSSYQVTLGKMIFGMKVTDLNGNRISFERATGRHFAKWLSAMILGIGYIMVGFPDRKQGLHNLLPGTLVRRA